MPTYFAQVTYTGNGSTTSYAIPFSYIDSSHVKAYINGTLTSEFTISTSTLIFTTAPANGATIRIQRETPIDVRLVDFADGSVLTEADLDRSANQSFYVAQEITDDQVNNLAVDVDDKWDAKSKTIKNIASPVNDNDAVNKAFITTNLPAINNVNANIGTVTAVANNSTNINNVAAQISPTNNIGTLAGLANEITGVYNIRTDVTAVANNNANITTVASNIGKVNTLYTEINKVIGVADDLQEAVSEIDTVANNINNVNQVGNNIANVNIVGSTISSVNDFVARYRISATAPTTSLDVGDLWFDTTATQLKIYTANGWEVASAYLENLVNDYRYDISGSPSYVEGASNNANAAIFDYTQNSLVNVFVNGLRIIPTEDYTLSKNNNVARVTFTSPLVNGDVVYIQVFSKLATVEEQTLQGYVSTTLGYKNTTEGFKNTTEGFKNSAQTSATNSANSATASANSATASQNSATASAASAASSLQSLNSFNAAYTYSTTPPNNPANGAIWFDTATTRLKVYVSQNNTGWVNVGTYVEGLITNYTYTATQGQTVFNGADVDGKTLAFNATGNVFVFVNGIRITPTADYVLSAGNTCTLGVAANAGDVIYIEVIQKISLTEEQLLQSYVASALADKNTATTQAGIATTQAGISTTKAGEASASASAALASQNASATSEANALSYRNTTLTYKDAANQSAIDAAASAALATVGGGVFKITANDTTANVFNLKVSVGNGITKTLNNAGGNESVTLSLPFTETVITPTNGQTVFNTTYVVNFVQVYVNGVKLIKGVDFTATDGTTITLNDALLSNDVVEIVKFA